MSKKWSSFKEQQMLTESFRKWVNEDTDDSPETPQEDIDKLYKYWEILNTILSWAKDPGHYPKEWLEKDGREIRLMNQNAWKFYKEHRPAIEKEFRDSGTRYIPWTPNQLKPLIKNATNRLSRWARKLGIYQDPLRELHNKNNTGET